MGKSDNWLTFSLIAGIIGGIAISHIYKTRVNKIWNAMPFLDRYPGNVA